MSGERRGKKEVLKAIVIETFPLQSREVQLRLDIESYEEQEKVRSP